MSMKKNILIIVALAVMVLSSSCAEDNGPFNRETSTVIFTISEVLPASEPFGDILTTDGTIPGDTVNILFANYMKDQTWAQNKIYSDVILNSMTVSFRRTDGGYDVPAAVRGGLTFRVLADGINQLDGVTIIPATTKAEFPLSDLIYYGYERSTNYTKISLDVIIEVEGHTVEGEPVQAKGYTHIIIANWAD